MNQAVEQLRIRLVCAFRWAARLNLHESIANHFSVAVSGDGREFLINPYGKHFSTIKASDLLLVNADDPASLDRPDAPDITAWALHSALHRNQPHARCILHTHSKYATALVCLADSRLPPIEQNSMRFFERVAIDNGFEGGRRYCRLRQVSLFVEIVGTVGIAQNHIKNGYLGAG
jgi:ribulose-5-phosphate 4-epimerase/fuculose-1-phosphate aldolase